MPDAYVLLTAMPPTKGHLQLIQFADSLVGPVDGNVNVIVNTQPEEPLSFERYSAIRTAVHRDGLGAVGVRRMHETLEQDPSTPGFREMWRDIMLAQGFKPGDYVVASETYGKWLAEIVGGRFFPYDIERSINPTKATPLREDPFREFHRILPEFQRHLRPTVTVFGAESCGKTTLSKELAKIYSGWWIPEWARPFLENTSHRIDTQSMTDIWHGQAALQRNTANLYDRPVVVQDTDLFSTVGYWNLNQHGLGHLPAWSGLGAAPQGLIDDALSLQSDLYLVVQSNIPFEEDPLRYGGTEREGTDAYWIKVCEEYGLPYVVIEASGRGKRIFEAMDHMNHLLDTKADLIRYDRGGF